MANYGVVRTDNMYGTDVREGLVSVRYMGSDGQTATAIENGNVVKLGDLVNGEREVFVGGNVAASDSLKDVVLVASVEEPYDERKRNLSDFINEAGANCRGYHFHSGGIFSVTKEALTGVASPAKNDIVEFADGTKLNVAKTATSDSTVVGKIIDIETTGRYTYYVIKID